MLAAKHKFPITFLSLIASVFFSLNTYATGTSVSQSDATRLLSQGAFGPSMADITRVQALGIEGWIDHQLSLTPQYHVPLITKSYGHQSAVRLTSWWKTALWGEDQLRQRMAYALSQIFVVSEKGGKLFEQQKALTEYYDTLVKHGLGNFRNLLTDITLHPVMGKYLTHANNKKADEAGTRHPDENYARELLQLMTIGTVSLNSDGSAVLDDNNLPAPSYDQDIIQAFARVFTGLCTSSKCAQSHSDYTKPLGYYDEYHDSEEKTLLYGVQLPQGQSAAQDVSDALDNVFNHANVGPFISKLLIQRLVTSNPTPDYIARVTAVFNDDGNGVRGNLAQVAKAILLDEEARHGHLEQPNTFGKMREPILRMAHMYRALNAIKGGNEFIWYKLANCTFQEPLGANSVFNFYHANFRPAALDTDLVAPEFAISNEAQMIKFNNCLFSQIRYGVGDLVEYQPSNKKLYNSYQQFIDIWEQETITGIPGDDAVIDRFALLFTGGEMSMALRQTLLDLIAAIREKDNGRGIYSQYDILTNIMLIIFLSPEFVIQR